MAGPKYNAKYLRSKLQELLGEARLDQTLTNIFIPTFDIKLLQPTMFTTHEEVTKCASSWANRLRFCDKYGGRSGAVFAEKLYPAGATTNFKDGVTDLIGNCFS